MKKRIAITLSTNMIWIAAGIGTGALLIGLACGETITLSFATFAYLVPLLLLILCCIEMD